MCWAIGRELAQHIRQAEIGPETLYQARPSIPAAATAARAIDLEDRSWEFGNGEGASAGHGPIIPARPVGCLAAPRESTG
jgi:hypothetical protein